MSASVAGRRRQRADQIRRFCTAHGWVEPVGDVTCLAAGEYNESWRVTGSSSAADVHQLVCRINHGTQLQLDDQAAYEFAVLRAVAPSGVTPIPYLLSADAPGGEGRGTMLMEYLPGQPLDYAVDLEGAARCLARVHQLPPSADLIDHGDPLRDVVEEARHLLSARHPHPLPEQGARLTAWLQELAQSAEASGGADLGSVAVVNTEVNSHNFLVDGDTVRLVDWEKAVNSTHYLDLAHFLAPTTTLWIRGYRLSAMERERFFVAYAAASGGSVDAEQAAAGTAVVERFVLLRALCWCYMAFADYAASANAAGREGSSRPRHDATFARITEYLESLDDLIPA